MNKSGPVLWDKEARAGIFADALLLIRSLNLSIDLKQKVKFFLSCSPDTSLQLSWSETSVSVSETSPGEFTMVPPQSH